MDKPVKLRKGMELMKQRGKTGPVRRVKRIGWPHLGVVEVTLEWTQTTKRKGEQTLQEVVTLGANGLPWGYVLAKDRKAKKAGAK